MLYARFCSVGTGRLLARKRIQTKNNLWKRRMLQEQQINCVLCGLGMETPVHLFLHCVCASKIKGPKKG
ncbi:hypothetical protein P8452_66622 [Trifolium repens]|nr:hypothetical protein P8452_66622 [Trifolium repens]